MNKDVLGWRAKFGVVGPSTNTVVQPDLEAMRPIGVTNHYGRIDVQNRQDVSDETFIQATTQIGDNTLDAVRVLMSCAPDYLVMGMSAVTFYGGVKGAEAFRDRIAGSAGIPASVGSLALAAALRAYGVRRIAFLSPYFPSANREVARFLGESGFQVVRDEALRCRSWTGIAEVDEAQLRRVLRRLDGDNVDAIAQVGTNLSMVRLAAEAERWLGKPVVAINTATYWHALRAFGIDDKITGFGQLLELH